MTGTTSMVNRWLSNLPPSVILAGVLIGLVTGFQFGYSNQSTYLAGGLRILDPQYLNNDWWATDTTHYHRRFAYLVALLGGIGSLPWLLAMVNALINVVAAIILFVFTSHFSDDESLVVPCWVVTCILFFGVTSTSSVAGSYVFSAGLQPSSLAAIFFLAAMYTFVSGQYALSGVFLALSGWSHTNFLLLAFPVFGLAHILIGRQRFVVRCISQFGLLSVVFVLDLPLILQISATDIAPEVRAEAARIFTEIRAPHHYEASFRGFVPLFAVHFAAVILLTQLDNGKDFISRFSKLHRSFLALLLFGFAFSTVFDVEVISRLFIWRMAPFSLVLAYLVLGLALAKFAFIGDRAASDSHPILRLALISFAVLVLGIANLGLAYGLLGAFVFTCAIGTFRWQLVATNSMFHGSERKRLAVLGLGIVVLLGVTAIRADFSGFRCRFNLVVGGCQEAQNELYEWARENTDVDAVFLIPPGFELQGFRLLGQRAIVVSWKEVPLKPDEIMQWYGRIADVSGGIQHETYTDVVSGYDALTDDQIGRLIQKYRIGYVVRAARTVSANTGAGAVFRNTEYAVLPAAEFSTDRLSSGD